jgi:hypothetical protein
MLEENRGVRTGVNVIGAELKEDNVRLVEENRELRYTDGG